MVWCMNKKDRPIYLKTKKERTATLKIVFQTTNYLK